MMDTMFSKCRTWRYTLSRRWTQDTAPRFANFILLNPSTADETRDDPTIRRCIGFTKREGFAAMIVTNIFAFRATQPKDLKKAYNPIGPSNNQILRDVAQAASLVVLGWGNDGTYRDRGADVSCLLKAAGVQPYTLGWTQALQPRHPLYVKSTSVLVAWAY